MFKKQYDISPSSLIDFLTLPYRVLRKASIVFHRSTTINSLGQPRWTSSTSEYENIHCSFCVLGESRKEMTQSSFSRSELPTSLSAILKVAWLLRSVLNLSHYRVLGTKKGVPLTISFSYSLTYFPSMPCHARKVSCTNIILKEARVVGWDIVVGRNHLLLPQGL